MFLESLKPYAKFVSHLAEETAEMAEQMAAQAKPGDVFALTGDLGMGKTVFVQGFARGLGYTGRVTSPTFTLMNIYNGGRLVMHHFDLYRLEDAAADLEGIGYDDYIYAEGVSLIEWAERAEELLPEHTVFVSFARGYEDNERIIRVYPKETAQ